MATDFTPTQQRDRAIELARTDPLAALPVAREVSEPWFRCQALAYVGRFAPQTETLAILDEALAASQEAPDPYRRVGAAAWWLRAALDRGYESLATKEVPRLLATAKTIENPVSRMDALFLVFQAAFDRPAMRDSVLAGLVDASRTADSWKAQWILREAALMLAHAQSDTSARVVEAMPEGKYKRQVTRRIAEKAWYGPPRFFR